MKNFKFQKRKGIGTVITTLIVLIASVVLGAGVIFFGGSLFSTNTQSESIQVSNEHIWVASNGTSLAGFVVQNTGDKVVSVQSISIRGQSVPTGSWYYNIDDVTATAIQTELVFDDSPSDGVDFITGAPEETMTHATGPISLAQGEAAIVYLAASPAGISAIDTGLSFTMNVQAGQATAVQSVTVVSE